MNDFLPHRDNELGFYTARLAQALAADPQRYGVSAAQAAAYASMQIAFAQALAVTSNPGTRTSPAVQTKDTARAELITLTRQTVALIQAHPGTTDTMRVDLGITVRKQRVRAVAVTTERPMVWVESTSMGVTLRVETLEGNGRARPTGAKGFTWYYAVGESYPQDMRGWSFGGNAITRRVGVKLPSDVPAGSRVWFIANWFNNRMQPGQCCAPVQTRVAVSALTQGSTLMRHAA